MLQKSEIYKIRENLEKSQNPLFLFDNDVDGLCSFLILKKGLGRGKGFPIKTFPELNASYVRRVEELNADSVFILDHSIISEEFLEEMEMKNIPVTVIDHHELKIDNLTGRADLFNSYPSGEPTTYLCYKVYEKKEYEWLAMLGCIGDVFLPEFAEKFSKQNPDLYQIQENLFRSLFTTEIGKLARMLNCGLRDTTTNVVKLMKFLEKTKSISEITSESKETIELHKKFRKTEEYIEKTAKKAKLIQEKLILLEYSGENSLSSEISNYLLFKYPDKFILAAYKKAEGYNISIRGKKAKEILLSIIKENPEIAGGGHPEACGGRVPIELFQEFKDKLVEKLI